MAVSNFWDWLKSTQKGTDLGFTYKIQESPQAVYQKNSHTISWGRFAAIKDNNEIDKIFKDNEKTLNVYDVRWLEALSQYLDYRNSLTGGVNLPVVEIKGSVSNGLGMANKVSNDFEKPAKQPIVWWIVGGSVLLLGVFAIVFRKKLFN